MNLFYERAAAYGAPQANEPQVIVAQTATYAQVQMVLNKSSSARRRRVLPAWQERAHTLRACAGSTFATDAWL